MNEPTAVPPSPAQRYVDALGRHWVVDNVITSAELQGFFLARLKFGSDERCEEGTTVLAPKEFEALVRSRGLRPVSGAP